MGKVKPGVVTPEEAFPEYVDKMTHFAMQRLGLPPTAFPGLDALINAVPTRPPWERAEFLERHFEQVEWGDLLRTLAGNLPIPAGFDLDYDLDRTMFYRFSERPLTVLVVRFFPGNPFPWDNNTHYAHPSYLYYRLKWHLWWRRIDPTKDAKLRAILEGAMALDALAGRDL